MANATISQMHPSGVTMHVWSSANYRPMALETLLRQVIDIGRISEPGVYLVSWTNASHMPFGRIFTLHRVNGELIIKGGVVPERVTRWPPA